MPIDRRRGGWVGTTGLRRWGLSVAGLALLLALGSIVPQAPDAQEGRSAPAGRAISSPPMELRGSGRQEVQVRLNGRTALRGIMVSGGAEVYVRVADLVLAIDGSVGAPDSRVRLVGPELHGVVEGGCDGCAVRVRRPVLISASVRSIAREPYVPLADLVRAFEGRLEEDAAGAGFDIFAGKCTWCVLEPRTGG